MVMPEFTEDSERPPRSEITRVFQLLCEGVVRSLESLFRRRLFSEDLGDMIADLDEELVRFGDRWKWVPLRKHLLESREVTADFNVLDIGKGARARRLPLVLHEGAHNLRARHVGDEFGGFRLFVGPTR